MNNFNWLVAELLAQQAIRQLETPHPRLAPVERRDGHNGVKRSLASKLVRLGLRLDPAAGEGLGAFDLSLARTEGGRQA